MTQRFSRAALAVVLMAGVGAPLAAEAQQPAAQPAAQRPSGPAAPPATATAATPPGYVIGVDDALSIVFWREKDLSVDVVVRPDGRVSIPLLNEVVAAGLTPDQLREKVQTEAARYVQD